MVSTIGPLVKADWRNWGLVAAYVIAGLVVSSVLGALLGWAGALLIGPGLSLGMPALGGVALVYGIAEVVGRPLPLPSAPSSVPQEWWREWPSGLAALASGAVLSIGALTVVRYPAYWAIIAYLVLARDPAFAAAGSTAYAAARAVSILAGVTLIAAGVPDRQIATIGLGHTTLLRRVLGALLVSFALLLLVRILTPLA